MPASPSSRCSAVEMRARVVAELIDELRRGVDHRLHRGILAVEDAQRIRVQPALRIVVEDVAVPLEVRDQLRAMRAALVRVADRVDLQLDAVEPERVPQPREHHDLLGVDVRAREAERLDVELVELPVAALLRALVAEHRSASPHALRPVVQ